jgi:hypothetical protein
LFALVQILLRPLLVVHLRLNGRLLGAGIAEKVLAPYVQLQAEEMLAALL